MSWMHKTAYVTQIKTVRKRQVQPSSLPRVSFRKQEADMLPRDNLLRFIQEESLLDNSRCIDYNPQLIVKESRLLSDLLGREDNENQPMDGRQHRPVHKRSVQTYYKHYKKLVRIKEQNSLLGCKSSAFTVLLDKSVKLKALPVRMGFIRDSGSESQLKLSNFKLGDHYAEMLSEGLAHNSSRVSQLLLSNNRITDKGASQLLKKLVGKAKNLQLSHNNIQTLEPNFIKSLQHKDCQLERLLLQNNRLSTASLTSLLNILVVNRSLLVINLSQNNVGNEGGPLLANLLEENEVLTELYLRWNRLGSQSAVCIFQSLAKNNSLRVLDLSFNLLGGGGPAVAQALRKNTHLIHMDLSQNKFSLQECDQIAEALRKNHTLYGLHFSGNYGFIDSKGFLVIGQGERTTRSTYCQTSEFRIEGVSLRKRVRRSFLDFQLARNVCWICQGWSQHTFQIQKRPGSWVHLSHEAYEGRLLNQDSYRCFYKTMVPPGKLFYFYTNGEKSFNQRADRIHQRQCRRQEVRYFGQKKWIQVRQEGQKTFLGNAVFTGNYLPVIQVLPRFQENQPQKQKVQEMKWKFQISVWYREWKGPDQQTNLKCFERDWAQSRITKLVKANEDQQRVRKLLLENYSNIRNIYKHFSAISPIGDTWSITTNAFSQLCNTAKLVDARLPLKILDLVFITTNSATAIDWRGNPRNPERGIVRFQFLQALVRLADQKFIKNGIHDNYFDSVNAVINQNLTPLYKLYDADSWRRNRYFLEENDILLKRYRQVFQHVYKRFSKLKVKPGEKAFMSNDEFKAICLRTELTSGRFQNISEKDASISYNLSMMIQVDELQSERIFRMQFIEFVEAFARMCDLAVPPRIGLPEQDQPRNLREEYPLHLRLEWGLSQLVKTCSAEQVKQAYSTQLSQSLFPK